MESPVSVFFRALEQALLRAADVVWTPVEYRND